MVMSIDLTSPTYVLKLYNYRFLSREYNREYRLRKTAGVISVLLAIVAGDWR